MSEEARTHSTLLATSDNPEFGQQTSLSADPRWQLAQRVVASRRFAKSTFLTNFLLYVCDRELRGRAHEITELQIGVQALGRPENYNPGEDNIVRNYARLLRKRLNDYFETEGAHEPLRIDIPSGRYIPVFGPQSGEEPVSSESNPAPAASVEPGELSTPLISRPVAFGMLAVLFMALGVALTLASVYVRSATSTDRPRSSSHALWTRVFDGHRETLIVPADSGFGILQNLTRHPIHLTDYVSGHYLSTSRVPGVDSRNLNDLTTQRYTSVVDLNIASSLSRLPEFVPERTAIRYARDLRMEDLKHSNAILLGSLHTNPWVELFDRNMTFVLEYQLNVDDSIIVNRHPVAGESATYKNEWEEESHRTYAVLAVEPSLDNQGLVILVEGLNMAGTQAAGDFLLNEQSMGPILKNAARPDGSLRSFELLLETNSIGANAPEARVIAQRYSSLSIP